MRIEFKVTGKERKRLVEELGRILDVKPNYMGMPSAAYKVGDITVTKDGALEFDDNKIIVNKEQILQELNGKGFETDSDEPKILVVEYPIEKMDEEDILKLKKLISAKKELFSRAFNCETIEIKINKESISFPWFQSEMDKNKTYQIFVEKLCKMVINQKRVNSSKKEVENEKYEFRCFLLKLGFIGDDYKKDRKILLENLTGSSAFKIGEK